MNDYLGQCSWARTQWCSDHSLYQKRQTYFLCLRDHCREKTSWSECVQSQSRCHDVLRVKGIYSLSECCCWHIGYWMSALCRSVVTNGGRLLKRRMAHQGQQLHIMCGNIVLHFALKASCCSLENWMHLPLSKTKSRRRFEMLLDTDWYWNRNVIFS